MEPTQLIIEAASTAGVAGPAMPDLLARSTAHFSAKEVNPESVQAFLTGLKTDAPHLFTPPPARTTTVAEDMPVWLPPSERLTRARERHPQPPVQRRPQPYIPTAEQLKSLEGKTPTERLSAYRAWQTQATGGTP